MPSVTGTEARLTALPLMLDIARLRTTVTSGEYIVDPFAVADALLSRAGIATPPSQPAERQSFSAVDARSRPGPAPRLQRG